MEENLFYNENIKMIPLWLPEGKKAAICFSIDDIHPAKGTDQFEAGGDLDKGRLGLVKWLLDRHPKLKMTLFITADWLEISPDPTRKILAKIPYVRDHVYLTKHRSKGTFRIDNHPEFVKYLNDLENVEVAIHGLHHLSKGLNIPIEFQHQSTEKCQKILKEIITIFQRANLIYTPGICPPGWNAPNNLLQALKIEGFQFISSARDVFTKISTDSTTNMSGFIGVPLIYPVLLEKYNLIHIPVNFHATSNSDRAKQIIDNEGLVSIKAHIIKTVFGHTLYDGVDEVYMNYLDVLFNLLEREYGEDLWWTSMGEITNHILSFYETN